VRILCTRIMPKARDSLRYSSPQDAALGDGPLFHFLLRSQTVRFRPRPTSAALRPCRSPACRGRHPESGQSIPGPSRPGWVESRHRAGIRRPDLTTRSRQCQGGSSGGASPRYIAVRDTSSAMGCGQQLRCRGRCGVPHWRPHEADAPVDKGRGHVFDKQTKTRGRVRVTVETR